MRPAQGTGLGFEFTFGETGAGDVRCGSKRELRGRDGEQTTSVWGQSCGGLGGLPQDDIGPSVLVSVPTDQHLLLGAEEGIFILNRNDQEATLEMVRPEPGWGGWRWGFPGSYGSHLLHSLQLFPSRTTWVYSINNVLMSLSGLAVDWVGGVGSEVKGLRARGLGDTWAQLGEKKVGSPFTEPTVKISALFSRWDSICVSLSENGVHNSPTSSQF